jgi:hypothetical protein
VAELDGEKHSVGAVHANVVIEVFDDVEEYAEVLVKTANLQPAEGARLRMKKSALERCSR